MVLRGAKTALNKNMRATGTGVTRAKTPLKKTKAGRGTGGSTAAGRRERETALRPEEGCAPVVDVLDAASPRARCEGEDEDMGVPVRSLRAFFLALPLDHVPFIRLPPRLRPLPQPEPKTRKKKGVGGGEERASVLSGLMDDAARMIALTWQRRGKGEKTRKG